MILLLLFSFIAGFVTILSPCILPVLPIVLSSSLKGGHRRPIGVVIGFIASFSFFTLFLTSIVKATGLPPDTLRLLSVIVIALFGASLLLPHFQVLMERVFTKLSSLTSHGSSPGSGLTGGILLGLSLGLVWTPCVGPIIASVITLAATSSVNFNTVLIILAYSLGTGIPMLAISYGGRKLLQRVPFLTKQSIAIQKVFGVIMIIIAAVIFLGWDRSFQTFILDRFPQYGAGLTQFETNDLVKNELNKAKSSKVSDMFTSYQKAPELVQGGEWFNSKPLLLSQLRGKVVLIDFWTYTCINCIRTLPYLKSWDEKYRDQGLVIIGVHTPEFEFEKDKDNVAKAISDFGIKYPVMQDNNFATWNAYNNQYWPAHYLIDKDGYVRDVHFGEGNYDETEKTIQELLKEAGKKVNEKISNPTYDIQSLTPETYVGYSRAANFVQLPSLIEDKEANYELSKDIPSNYYTIGGAWKITSEMAQPSKGGVLEFKFDSKDVYLVLTDANKPAQIKVFLDGKVVDDTNQGTDVKDGIVNVDSNRLYNLIKLSAPSEHTLRLEFLDNNASLYAFTFG